MTYVNEISDNRMVVDLLQERTSLLVVSDLSELNGKSIGTVTRVSQNVVGVDDDICEGVSSFSSLQS